MSFTTKKFEISTILFFVVFGAYLIVKIIENNSTNVGLINFLYSIGPLLVIGLCVLIIVELFSSLRYMALLIDSYIDEMLSGKKYKTPSHQFYCQVCKAEVGRDDNFCGNCGMTM